ncbi:hypothetical protein SLUN_04950 [Streptomyces lunaelactis]|uniref:Uncharacterized protein n=1 Tax=Streptomyces lunaelactis TaxID=1535768 RepID=A0A2R4SXM7_9ACTN|nr:DUF6643 family protein [Streptomyces lunaelactis]AVZ71635.1 hypothetical protein SLUN_04950 [Streptomyces lunaelactis]NUK06797.1 hypothetical protein [Streptomyces lunaelactis]NUK33435.1 hypothetical protein [Streptomyces lunaelactis]NUK40013.1 hypothetical protein [Streptomyces lunaelactis]NUK49424.1 hypothetical protein [Streptomyces lunaelactis]
MTSPRATYGGGYYSAPSFPDTPIYDSLVAERGTPQIAPIRVPSAYDTGNSYLPALPSALPALPAGPSQSAPSYGGAPSYGYPQQMQQPMPLQHAPAPYIPQQHSAPRGYPGAQPQAQPQYQQQQRPVSTGYEAMRPAAARPAPAPASYDDPYNRPYQGRGY